MHTPTETEIAAARDIVSHPQEFADQLALRESAWRTLVEARGGHFAASNIPVMTHAEPGRPARGVAAQLARQMTAHAGTPRPAPALDLKAALAHASPTVSAAVARYAARREDPNGGSAA